MKQFLFFCLCSTHCFAQFTPSFKPLRYDENYAPLKADSTTSFYQTIKYKSLSATGNAFVSFGGDVRFQYYHVINDEWGEQLDKNYGYVFSRYLAHADFHAGKYFRAYLELQSGMANAKASTSPADENPLDLHQAFFDVNLAPGKPANLILRAGRQELYYGSQRLISVREGPNNRHSFDGLKVIYVTPNRQTDLFYTHYVASKKGVFDDGFNKNTRLWGVYSVFKNLRFIKNLDLYYLGLEKKTAAYDDGKAREVRHSLGTRIWGKTEQWRYDLEAVYQFGDFANKKINAWTASAHIDYMLNHLKFVPEIGLKTEIISGDATYGDNKLGTFNPLFPRGGYFGLAALVGPANLIDVHPSINLTLTEKLALDLDYDVFWRYSVQDGVYGPNAALIYSGKNTSSKFTGQQYSAVIDYETSPFLSLAGEFTWFKTGQFLKEAGPGKNILFACITAELKF
ncbi:alginate export family protein [Dyadobacter pollutisoli]|uniref:Alginate export family protein n=1 Tax=Dyadobacter pollutisoli TaxID=2910158 RepID=A0A9E8NGY8_9BACT|nr:alginate export family protein [Dyadobacter pollutisoli]WAC14827.1 alginate export family protein [Dyadobacter pollutisoli]